MRKASVDLRVTFRDLDGMRTVYHPVYITYFDYARTKLMRECGIAMEKWEEGGIMLPLVDLNIQYLASGLFDDPLRVTAEIVEVKRKIITIKYEIVNLDTGKLITTGETKQVFCDENGKSFVLEEKYPEVYKTLTSDN